MLPSQDITNILTNSYKEKDSPKLYAEQWKYMAAVLDYTGADGFDIDWEGGMTQVTGLYLIRFLQNLKNYRRQIGKDTIITFTPLSSSPSNIQGNLNNPSTADISSQYDDLINYTKANPDKILSSYYNQKGYGDISNNKYIPSYPGDNSWVIQSLLYKDCPIDYIIPMLYDGGQYTYDINNDDWAICNGSAKFSWNCLLNYWLGNDMDTTRTAFNKLRTNVNNKTEIIAAFIGYSQKSTFCCDQLKVYMDRFLNASNNQNDGNILQKPKLAGTAFFYLDDLSNYSDSLLNTLIRAVSSGNGESCVTPDVLENGSITSGLCKSFYQGSLPTSPPQAPCVNLSSTQHCDVNPDVSGTVTKEQCKCIGSQTPIWPCKSYWYEDGKLITPCIAKDGPPPGPSPVSCSCPCIGPIFM